MDLNQFINNGNLIVLRSRTKEKALQEIYNAVLKKHEIKEPEDVFQEIMKREAEYSTGFGKGIAIPHYRFKNVQNTIIHVGISRKGIEYDSVDGIPVKIIFFIISGTRKEAEYLQLVSRLINFVNKENLIVQNLNFDSKKLFLEHLSHFEVSESKHKRSTDLALLLKLQDLHSELKSLEKEQQEKSRSDKKGGKTLPQLTDSLKKEIKKTEKKIDMVLFHRFERLLKKYKGAAAVKLFNDACSFCFNVVPTKEMVRLKNGEVVQCSFCGKILYID